MFSSSVSKYSFKLHTTFSGSLQWQQNHIVQIQNGLLLPFNTIIKTLTLNADTRLNSQLNVTYRVISRLTDSHSPAKEPADHILQLKQLAIIYYEPTKRLQLKLSGEHYFTSRRGNANLNYFFADAVVKYRIKKCNTDIELDATNLLDVKTYDAVYLSANMLTASSYVLPGRIVMFKLLFNL